MAPFLSGEELGAVQGTNMDGSPGTRFLKRCVSNQGEHREYN